jgi:hypothetical protein
MIMHGASEVDDEAGSGRRLVTTTGGQIGSFRHRYANGLDEEVAE